MRMTKLFFQTYREAPKEAETVSHQLLLRGGFIQPLASGIYSYLPLGLRVKSKVENIFREEMDAIGGQELQMPVVQPASLWSESGRLEKIGPELMRLQDHTGRDLVLAMTHEEAVTALARNFIKSYRQLPVAVYQIREKVRDELRSRGGIIRVREFTMKDLYSFHESEADLDSYYEQVYQAYHNIFFRVGLEAMAVLSDSGMMGGSIAHEFMYPASIGEDTVLRCRSCGYSANREAAKICKPEASPSEALPLEEVHTPGATTIADLGAFEIEPSEAAKSTFFVDDADRFVVAVVPGDMDVNETKLKNLIGALSLRPATAEEISERGMVAGYGSPIGIDGIVTAVDELILSSANLVAGANREDYHLRNVNYGREFTADFVDDLVVARQDDPCPVCNSPLVAMNCVELGNTFKLGIKYSEQLSATFLDKEGKSNPCVMGSYGIGSGRLLACVVEEFADKDGICWPITIAPYHVQLVCLDTDKPEVANSAEQIYKNLLENGLEVIFDDRRERPGVKFSDSDLIGVPIRLTVSSRTLQKEVVEIKLRGTGEQYEVPQAEVLRRVQSMKEDLEEAIISRVRFVPIV